MGRKWTELIVGLVLIISPWMFGFSDISLAKWCNILVGLALALAGAWMIFGQTSPALGIVSDSSPPSVPAKRRRKTKNQ